MISIKDTLKGKVNSSVKLTGKVVTSTIKLYPELEDLTVTPNKEQQTFNHENSYGYDKITVEAISDEYIIPEGTLPITENATYDVRNYAEVSTSVYVAPTLQDKEVTPTKELQTITSDEDYDGLNKVTINPIPDNYIEPSGTLDINSNGDVDVTIFKTARVDVHVPPKLQNKELTINENSTHVVTADDNYDGLSEVSVTVETPKGITMNVFAQETEPEIKDGIWFQTNTEATPDVELASVSTVELTWGTSSTLPANNAEIGIATIGTDMYLVGGNPNGANVYKFDTLTNTLTQLSNLPYSAYGIAVAPYGTDLYIFGGRPTSGTKAYDYAYKYDTLTDTYTQLTSMPYITGQTPSVIHGTDIYLIGGHTGSGVHSKAYKYNILTDTYTQLTDLPAGKNAASTILYKDNIYILGGYRGGNLNEMLKYSINDDTYTQLADLPYKAYGIAAGLYSRYIIFATGATLKSAYAYNITTDTYIPLPDLASGRQRTSGTVVGDKFYIVGGTSNKEIGIGTIANEINEYENERDTAIIIPSTYNKNRTVLSSSDYNTYVNIGDVYYYKAANGVDYTVPIHIGNGTNWIEF